MFNVTIISSISKEGSLRVGKIAVCDPAVEIEVEINANLMHYTSYLFLHIATQKSMNMLCEAALTVHLDVDGQEVTAELPIFVEIRSQPRREKRVLWDLYHSAKYPEEGRIFRDENKGGYLFDWRGDHPYTNYVGMYERLVSLGYVVDLGVSEFNCVDADSYGVYLIIDPEVIIEEKEAEKIRYDVEQKGVNLLVLADWYDQKIVDEISLDKQAQVMTRKGLNATFMGSSIPSLNEFLANYFIELSVYDSYSGSITLGPDSAEYQAGAVITRFPHGGYLLTQYLESRFSRKWIDVPILGLFGDSEKMQGRIAVFGDSSCFDRDAVNKHCLWLLYPMLSFLEQGYVDSTYFPASSILPGDYDYHKELKTIVKGIKKTGTQCSVIHYDSQFVYHHNYSSLKLNHWVSSPETVKSRETKVMVYLERAILVGFCLLALAVYFSGKGKRRSSEESLPVTLRRSRRLEECSMVASRRSKSNLNTLPIDIQL